MTTNNVNRIGTAVEPETKSLAEIIDSFFSAFKRLWWIAVIFTIIFGIWGFYNYKKTYVANYQTEATFSITAPEYNGTDQSYTNNNQLASNLSVSFDYLINNEVFYEIIKQDIGIDYIPGVITISAVEETNILSIAVSGANPETNYKIINSVMKNYSSVAEFVLGDTQLTVLEEPTVENVPINPYQPVKNVMMFALIGCFLGLIPSIIYAFFVRTIKSKEDIENFLSVSCLGALPAVLMEKKDKELSSCSILNKNVGFRYLEAMRSITSRCEKEFEKNNCRVILITSTDNGEGKSTFAMNLAYSLSKIQKKVMLIDGNLRNPELRKMIQADMAEYSMESFLKKEVKSSEAIINIPASRVLLLAPSEMSRQPVECLNSEAMAQFIEEGREVVDYIIIDSPPCADVSDAAVLAKYSDGIIYMVKEDFVKVNKILDTIQEFSYTRIPILGCILNATEESLKLSYRYETNYGRYNYRRYSNIRYGGYGYGAYGEVSDKEYRTKSRSVAKHIRMKTTEEQKKALEKERFETIDE